MIELEIKTRRRCEIVDITSLVSRAIPEGMKQGFCLVFSPHTTAGITVNENADPDVKHDFLAKLEALVPKQESFYRHAEGNSDAHLKASMVGFSQMLPVENATLDLGVWQGIYFCEFDGPRTRRVRLYFTA